jgi:hypothetical protein
MKPAIRNSPTMTICSRLDIRMLDSHSTETQANNESLENAHTIKILTKDPKI